MEDGDEHFRHSPGESVTLDPEHRSTEDTSQRTRPSLSSKLRRRMSASGADVEEPAYLKLMLHAAKHPWAAVGGFLLGVGAGDDKVPRWLGWDGCENQSTNGSCERQGSLSGPQAQ